MAKRFTITFPSDRPHDFYAPIWWFGEALRRSIVHGRLGTICDIDKIHNVVWFELADPHDLGKAKKLVRRGLAHYKLAADAVVSIT
jgi:hypothetical protein